MKRIFRSLKTVNYRLWFALLLILLLPTIYQTVRINFLGDMPNDWGFNIASQLQWLNLFYEVIQEALILPIFFIMGKYVNNREELSSKVRSGLLITGLVYSGLSMLVIIFAEPLVVFMAQDTSLLEATITYIRLETVAALFSTLVKFLMIVFITIKQDKKMYVLLAVQMVLSIILDTFLISALPISIKMGVNGIAVTNIIVNIILLVTSVLLLLKEKIFIFSREKFEFAWMKEWFHVGKYSGLESLLRNAAFMIMIVRMVNLVAE
ncbi:MAG: multidrug transporter, partial [Spirochaetales bacterium]|nr:multidrug transporter [Spirochaetales bacterium]